MDAISIKIFEVLKNFNYHALQSLAIVKTSMPLHTHAHSDTRISSRDSIFLLWELIWLKRQSPGIYF